MNEVKILGKTGYDDEYYWDYRIDFEYKGNKFKYINTGSGSGYYLAYQGIKLLKGDEEFLRGHVPYIDETDGYDYDEPNVELDILKEYAELCLANHGEYVLEDESLKY